MPHLPPCPHVDGSFEPSSLVRHIAWTLLAGILFRAADIGLVVAPWKSGWRPYYDSERPTYVLPPLATLLVQDACGRSTAMGLLEPIG
ncbi:hypothetical protein CONLIGDRAFT_58894 [Coniochaeta ligniaria NRRL 30616]|uniref:Uncharacterized protein n=1 Tax=Coniochaeta ligniaria NRRL 30616 TaxID=1408157 RepID=A0A1J7JZ72_9PEZI|nr:hypothetical protein CONLIGDRAFT_58894 [Coniochaeta ligniaria NRRL 30616]